MKVLSGPLVLLALIAFSPVHAFVLTLDAQDWHLISKPGKTNESIAEMFAGQLDAAEYNKTWAAFLYDNKQQQYIQADVNRVIKPGVAFWFQHLTDNTVQLNIDVYAPTVELMTQSPCRSPFGCFEFSLPTGNGVSWSMIGTAFPEGVEMQNIILETTAGPCRKGCSLEGARKAKLVGDSFYRVELGSGRYSPITADGFLNAGDGYWLSTTIPSEAGPARLLIPTYCTPFT